FAPENSGAGLPEASNFRVYTRRMNTQTETETETEIPNQASAYNLDHVSNSELHLSTRRLVGRSNQILAALLAHLGEIEARGIHRERACASLHTYLVYELRLSEDAAFPARPRCATLSGVPGDPRAYRRRRDPPDGALVAWAPPDRGEPPRAFGSSQASHQARSASPGAAHRVRARCARHCGTPRSSAGWHTHSENTDLGAIHGSPQWSGPRTRTGRSSQGVDHPPSPRRRLRSRCAPATGRTARARTAAAGARALQGAIHRQPGIRRPVAAGQRPFVARATERLDRTVASSGYAPVGCGAEEAPLRRGEAA